MGANIAGRGHDRATAIVITHCSRRKALRPPTELLARNLADGALEARACEWFERLHNSPATAIPSSELYKGEHWSVARSMGPVVDVLVASAGYGLISPSTLVKPYSASYDPKDEDFVLGISEPASPKALAAWWRCSLLNGPRPRSPASITSVAKTRRLPILAALSTHYLRAIAADLVEAAQFTSVLVAATAVPPELRAYWLPISGNLQRTLGGSMYSVSIRASRFIVQTRAEHGYHLSQARSVIQHLERRNPNPVRHVRRRTSDEQLRELVREAACAPTGPFAPTTVLKAIRSAGLAAEYGRFMKIYHQVTG